MFTELIIYIVHDTKIQPFLELPSIKQENYDTLTLCRVRHICKVWEQEVFGVVKK